MKNIAVLDTATGRLQDMSGAKLRAELKRRKQEAKKVLKLLNADHVVYAVEHTGSDGSKRFHLFPCTAYSNRKFAACFPKRSHISPLEVRKT